MQFEAKERLDKYKSSMEKSRDIGWNRKATQKHQQERRDLSIHDDWSLENIKKGVYGNEEVTKKQKRRGRATVSVRDLHKLQEIVRLNDAKLFYEHVEKEIEKETAATLEGSVAMKTRPIHNSVKQWADWAVIWI